MDLPKFICIFVCIYNGEQMNIPRWQIPITPHTVSYIILMWSIRFDYCWLSIVHLIWNADLKQLSIWIWLISKDILHAKLTGNALTR